MNIIHVITGLGTGGAERVLVGLLEGSLAERFNTHVVSLTDEGTCGPLIRELGVPVTTLNMRSGWLSISGLLKLRRIARAFRPDLIQGWMYHGNLIATLGRAMSPGSPVLAWNIRHSLYDLSHEKLITQQVIRANRFFSGAANALLYNSRLARQQHESFGFVARNGQVIPNGIDVQKFSFSSASRQRLRSELGIPADALVIGHVARLHPMKDHPTFLRAAHDVALRHPDVHFLLVGKNISLDDVALEQCIPARLLDRFHFLGERSDASDLMSVMDVFCLSSWSEAFPNVIGEAMATGVPCVATDVGDSEIIVGDTGVVIPPSDPDALGAAIEDLLMMPKERRLALGANARARIEANYALGTIVKKYAELYENLTLNVEIR